MHRFLVFSLALAPALAQQEQPQRDARSFVPPGHRCEAVVDFAALRASGLWEDLQASAAKMPLQKAETQLGFGLDHLVRIRMYPETPGPEELPDGQHMGGIAIFEGDDQIALPKPGDFDHADKVAGFEAVVDGRASDPDMWIKVRPGLLLYATQHLVKPLLDGTKKPGVTDPELLSLAAGRGVLLHAVVALTEQMFHHDSETFGELIKTTGMPKNAVLRLRTEEAEAENQFFLEAAVRFGSENTGEGKGPAALAAFVKEQIAALQKHPRFGALKNILAKIEVTVDKQDARARIALGRSRDAAGMFTTLMPLMMFTAVERAEAAPPVPVAPKPPGGGR